MESLVLTLKLNFRSVQLSISGLGSMNNLKKKDWSKMSLSATPSFPLWFLFKTTLCGVETFALLCSETVTATTINKKLAWLEEQKRGIKRHLKMDGLPYLPLCILRNPSKNLTVNILILCQLSGENHYRGKITEHQVPLCNKCLSVKQASPRSHPEHSQPPIQKKGAGHGELAWSTAWVIRPKL